MTTWFITTPTLGLQPIEEISTVKNHPLGTIIEAKHATYGSAEFIYLQGIGSTVAGSVVHYNDSFLTALNTTALDEPRPLAVAVGANVASRYGWYQISGIAYVVKSGSLCLLKGARIGVTAGAAVVVATGSIVQGAIVAIHASVVSPAETFVYCMINRPMGPSDVS
jgi:hypothetical protein